MISFTFTLYHCAEIMTDVLMKLAFSYTVLFEEAGDYCLLHVGPSGRPSVRRSAVLVFVLPIDN